jgi:hypothetical protein
MKTSMMRRTFLSTSAAGLAVAADTPAPKSALYHLTWYYMRSGTQTQRTNSYLSSVFMPAAQRAGAGPFGFFNAVIAARSPFVVSLVSYPSFAAMESVLAKLDEDKEFQKGADAYNDIADPPYIRLESSLLRAFPGSPAIELPKGDAQRPARVFELRTYESLNEKAGRRKVKMFDDGEAAVFRRVGMEPVFFGQAIVGSNLPSLSYMLSYENLSARDAAWSKFSADPEWQKIRSQPGLSDAEIVSNITNSILRPTNYSQVR